MDVDRCRLLPFFISSTSLVLFGLSDGLAQTSEVEKKFKAEVEERER